MKKIRKIYSGVVPNGKVLNSENVSLQDTYSCDYLNRTIPDTKDLGEIIVDDITCKNIIATNIKGQTINGLTITVNSDKTVTIKGTATSDTNIILNNTTYNTTNKIPAGTYTLSGGCQTFIEEGNNQGWWRSETKTFNTDTMLSSLGFYFYVSNGSTVDKTIYLQLEKGSVATDYVEHKEFSNKQIYSTEEQVIGTWIDNKPLYRKMFDFGALPSNSTKDVAHNISNVKHIHINLGETMWVQSNSDFISTTMVFSPMFANYISNLYTNESVVSVITNNTDASSFKMLICLEYTKTID